MNGCNSWRSWQGRGLPAGLPTKQKGVVLAIGLIFLLITTLMALTAMGGVVMQERMAGNLRSVSVAKAAAESALRAGEAALHRIVSRGEQINGACDGGIHGIFDRSDDLCNPALVDQFRRLRDNPGNAGGLVQSMPVELMDDDELSDPDYGAMAARPQYVIEHMGVFIPGGGGEFLRGGSSYAGDPTAPRVYRITGRGTGTTASVVRVYESYFAMVAGGGAICPDGSPMPPNGICP